MTSVPRSRLVSPVQSFVELLSENSVLAPLSPSVSAALPVILPLIEAPEVALAKRKVICESASR
jgi:hypothetical protein